MSIFTTVTISEETIQSLIEVVGEAQVITDADKVEKLSKDFYWYSPVLKRKLEDCSAALAIKIDSLEVLKGVISICARESIPITVRGGGTGNYGQAIPLAGGVVLDLGPMDKILSIADGVVRAEPGARMGVIEPEARKLGFEFRCLPSTWVKSSIGGFFCGGSGGIGSITWGGIASEGNVKSVTLLSVEENPRLVRLEEEDCLLGLHTYGTTGIMVELEMRLAPKQPYQQLIFNHADWDTLLFWTDSVARNDDIIKRLVTLFENPIPTYFRPLKKYLKEDEHAAFFLIHPDLVEAVVADASKHGISCAYSQPLSEPLKPPYITDYTWNHTTLWGIKADPSITYLQVGYGDNFKEQLELLRAKFPGEIYQHLEWTCGNPKLEGPERKEGKHIGIGAIPIIYFKSEERLQEIIDYCGEIGVGVANPHTYILEEGGRHPNIEKKRELKSSMDPKGLLNPGKMKTAPVNPFAPAAV